MKKVLLYAAALFAFVCAVGCKKEENKINYAETIIGEWHCTPEGLEADIYVSFDAEGGFELYQKIGEGRHRRYSGTYGIEGNTLSGTYSDGNPWGSSYSMESVSDKEMKLTALNGSEEVTNYFREDIPAEVKDNAVNTKGPDNGERPLL